MLQQKQQEFLQKWIEKHEAFEASIKKCEDRYDKNTPEVMITKTHVLWQKFYLYGILPER